MAQRRITPRDESGSDKTKGKRKPKQADLLIALTAEAELFHDGESVGYATIAVDGHRETYAVKSREFRLWLRKRFYQAWLGAPNQQALQDALGVIESRALFEGQHHETHVRVAECDDEIYLDLTNDRWQAARITGKGWEIVDDSPVKFVRRRGMQPLPTPERGGSLAGLRDFVNFSDDGEGEFLLALCWLLACFRPRGPYPVLILHGEQGSAKSTTARVLRSLIDPNKAPLRAEPREVRDLVIAANNSWLLALDNLSNLPPWISDALCRLATGGGFGTRELYTDADEILFEATRPILMNGIEELATRADLLDRAIMVYLPSIPPERRRAEEDFYREFEAARPALLGALLDAVSTGLRNMPDVQLRESARMADFSKWAVAIEPALPCEPGGFLEAYGESRRTANALTLEASPIGNAVLTLAEFESFEGTATELLPKLAEHVDESARRKRSWPATAKALGGALRRIVPVLRTEGVEVWFRREKQRRLIKIEKIGNSASPPSPSSPWLPENAHNPSAGEEIRKPQEIAMGDAAVTQGDEEPSTSPAYPKVCENRDLVPRVIAGDGGDADSPDESAPGIVELVI